MASATSRGKKRRAEVDLDAERTLYGSFSHAASAMSQLYSQAVQQQRKASAAASRHILERVLAFVLKEHGSSDSVPKSSLLHFLQQEYEHVDGAEHLPHHFPLPFIPSVPSQDGLHQDRQPSSLRAASIALTSPASGKRSNVSAPEHDMMGPGFGAC